MSIKGFKVGNKVEKYDYNALENIPDSLDDLFKYGEWGQVLASDGNGGVFWTRIETVEQADFSDIPDYVRQEAVNVMKKARSKQTDNTITFFTITDSHQDDNNQNVVDGNLHAGMGAKILAYYLNLDFCAYLGDYTTGSSTTTIAQGKQHFTEINADIEDAYDGNVQFRTVGNHDPLGYSYEQNGTALTPAELYERIGSYNDDGTTVMGSTTAGYCYRDFASKKVRVICLNTADAASYTGNAESVSNAQQQWFADTLISTPQGYGIIILSHHPLDWGNIMPVSTALKAFVNGETASVGGVSYNFANKNKSSWILNFHGHTHCFKVDKLHYNNGGTGVAYDVKRIASPNSCYNRNNEYGRNSSAEYYGIEFGEDKTYNKTVATAQDTAFCAYVIDPDSMLVYAFKYGAGYDRVINIDNADNTIYYSVTTNLSNANYYGATSVTSGSSLSATIGARSGYELATVKVMMGNNDITATAFSNGRISIPSVNDNITITAIAVETADATNVVPLSLNPLNYNEIFNNVGYKDDSYVSGTGEGTAQGYVATGSIDLPTATVTDISYIYIRGGNITTDGHCRFAIFNYDQRSSSWAGTGSAANGWMTAVAWITAIDKLADDYWRLTVDPSWAAQYMVSTHRCFRVSVEGVGSELFISINTPISSDIYDAYVS